MDDLFKLVGTLRPVATPGSPARSTPERPSQRDASAPDGKAALDAALSRLDHLVRSGAPLRPDAPRGSYLNVVV
jgi:hypothetical protein